jgi:hypothetical protein
MRTFLAFVFVCIPIVAFADPWPRHVIDDSSNGADGVKLGDVNADGRPDIATGWEEGGLIRVYLNPGPLKAKERWPAVTVGRVGSPEDATFADVDNDGDLDVVSCCEGKTKAIFFHRLKDPVHPLNEASWTTERIPAADGRMWMQCTPISLPPVGRTGLIVGSKGENGVVAGLYPPDPRSEEPGWRLVPIMDADWVMSIERTAVHGNVIEPAVLVSDRKGSGRGVYLLYIPADSAAPETTWNSDNIGGRDHEVMFLATDFPRHSKVRLPFATRVVAATRDGPLLVWRHGSNWDPLREWEAHPMPPRTGTGKAVAIGDLNGDGQDDITATCENAKDKAGVFWLENPKNAIAEWAFHDISGLEGTKFDRVELLDLDADGDFDLLTCEERENLGVVWYENPLK